MTKTINDCQLGFGSVSKFRVQQIGKNFVSLKQSINVSYKFLKLSNTLVTK